MITVAVAGAMLVSAWFGALSNAQAASTKDCGTTTTQSGPFTQSTTTTQTSACNSNSTTGQQTTTTCNNPAGQVNTTSAHCK